MQRFWCYVAAGKDAKSWWLVCWPLFFFFWSTNLEGKWNPLATPWWGHCFHQELAKLTACCTPFLVVTHSPRQCFFAVFVSHYMNLLWFSSSSELRSLEITFNNILRKIWSLPRACHTGILHPVAGLHSIYNGVFSDPASYCYQPWSPNHLW